MDHNKLVEYVQNMKVDAEVLADTRTKMNALLDNDLVASQHIGDIWRAIIDIQKRLNQLYWVIQQKEGDSDSGKGSGQVQISQNTAEPTQTPAHPIAEVSQVNYQPKSATEITDRIKASRNQSNQQTYQHTYSNRQAP